ncbi:MAG: dephospho-CoA kinase, partial [Actinomycetota bacterium]
RGMTTTSDGVQHPVLLLGGGIGAGKSRVAAVFAERGFEVIEADTVGHDVLEHDAGAIAAVRAAWPDAVQGGVVDRTTLARIVFADPDALAKLESITHPAIGDTLHQRIEAATAPVVVEVPVMKVLAQEPYVRVAVVADAHVREDRAVVRGASRDDVRRRMRHQPVDTLWVAWADRVIDNSGDWDMTAVAVHALIDEVLGDG